MDEIVIRSMLKWPDVPSVYGWLRLDRRGSWLVRMPSGADAPRFERIGNAGVIDFIGRNYARDGRGRYFFQNGPQRVFVTVEYTPYVYRLDDAARGFLAHTGEAAGRLERAMLDEHGQLLLECERGVGVVLDRDLGAVLAAVHDPELDDESLIAAVQGGRARRVCLLGEEAELAPVLSAEVSSRYGFEARPEPPPGERVC